jgi:hypothetical protein
MVVAPMKEDNGERHVRSPHQSRVRRTRFVGWGENPTGCPRDWAGVGIELPGEYE